jgi:uracil phosphoribosyltransferase
MTHQLTNPVTKTLITKLRDQRTDAFVFRHTIKEITKQLAYEALNNVETVKKDITTWQGQNSFDTLNESDLLVVTVLRAGLPMIESITDLLPDISAGFLAMKRDETTHESVLYYDRVPNCKGKTILLVDPMLATGGSMTDAIELLKTKEPSKIIGLNIIGSPEGIKNIEEKHPDVDIFISQIDEKLNNDKFIIPGLGDAGDRSYNTVE